MGIENNIGIHQIDAGTGVKQPPKDVRGGYHKPQTEIPHKPESLGKKVTRWAAGTIAAVMVVAGVADVATDGKLDGKFFNNGGTPSVTDVLNPGTEQSSSETAKPTPVETAKPTPTATPTPEATTTLSSEQLVDKEMQEKLALAPEIDGLNKEIQEINGLKRVVYVAETENIYGVEAGKYAGEYKQEINFCGALNSEEVPKQTGGVALVPNVANFFLDKELKTKNVALVLPMDIADLTTNMGFDINLFAIYSAEAYGIMIASNDYKINFNVDVLNVIPEKTEVREGIDPINKYSSICSSFNREANDLIEGKEMEFVTVDALMKGDPFEVDGKTLSFGSSLGSTENAVFVSICTFNGYTNRIHSFEDVVKVDGIPVFITNN